MNLHDVGIAQLLLALTRERQGAPPRWLARVTAIRLGRRSTLVIPRNLGVTASDNIVGIARAILGLLPPIWAVAPLGLPDVAIMLDSARPVRTHQARTS